MSSFLDYMSSSDALNLPRYIWDDANEKVRYQGGQVRHPSMEDTEANPNPNPDPNPNWRHPMEDTEVPDVIAHLGNVQNEGSDDTLLGAKAASFTMGPACTGSYWHGHDDAFCVLVHGRKYWALSNETEKINKMNDVLRGDGSDGENGYGQTSNRYGLGPHDGLTSKSYINYLRSVRGIDWWKGEGGDTGIEILECTQQPGDLIYIPRSYMHLEGA